MNIQDLTRPLKLKNSIQHYAWGTKNNNAFIPTLLGNDIEKDKPYAELWIGTHPKAPSRVILNSKEYLLNDLISKYPMEILGDRISKKFDSHLPFLLKVLSADQALSIQAHPDKKLAEALHRRDPEHYPDDNHKPEIAISLDKLLAICGFRPFEEIKEVLAENPEIYELLNLELLEKIEHSVDYSEQSLLKEIYSKIIQAKKKQLTNVINQLLNRIQKIHNKTERHYQFLEQYDVYGYDVGLFSIFLFNLIELAPDEAFFTEAGIPHAYIKGNIIECMANSDNVVRAGLTPKFKDIDTLTEMISYKPDRVSIIKNENNDSVFHYKTVAEEFELSLIQNKGNIPIELDSNEFCIYLILEGEVNFAGKNENLHFVKGESILIPSICNNYKLILEKGTKVIRAMVP